MALSLRVPSPQQFNPESVSVQRCPACDQSGEGHPHHGFADKAYAGASQVGHWWHLCQGLSLRPVPDAQQEKVSEQLQLQHGRHLLVVFGSATERQEYSSVIESLANATHCSMSR